MFGIKLQCDQEARGIGRCHSCTGACCDSAWDSRGLLGRSVESRARAKRPGQERQFTGPCGRFAQQPSHQRVKFCGSELAGFSVEYTGNFRAGRITAIACTVQGFVTPDSTYQRLRRARWITSCCTLTRRKCMPVSRRLCGRYGLKEGQ
jgi:hypothetical protein